MKALGLVALIAVLAAGWWLWRKVGVDVALTGVLPWCG